MPAPPGSLRHSGCHGHFNGMPGQEKEPQVSELPRAPWPGRQGTLPALSVLEGRAVSGGGGGEGGGGSGRETPPGALFQERPARPRIPHRALLRALRAPARPAPARGGRHGHTVTSGWQRSGRQAGGHGTLRGRLSSQVTARS
jgi:hypothetical protein